MGTAAAREPHAQEPNGAPRCPCCEPRRERRAATLRRTDSVISVTFAPEHDCSGGSGGVRGGAVTGDPWTPHWGHGRGPCGTVHHL
jgi:hypothetical protein